MSYPSVGIRGILPGDPEWTAGTMEKLLRDGHHIYFEDAEDQTHGYVEWDRQSSNFRFIDRMGGVWFKTDSFLEFAAWCAFYGRDFV